MSHAALCIRMVEHLWICVDCRASFELPIGQCSTVGKLHISCHTVSIAAQRLSKADAISCLSLHTKEICQLQHCSP